MRHSRPHCAAPVIARRVSRAASLYVCIVLCVFALSSCGLPGKVNPTVKIGLAAPFEGSSRDLGYEVLYAVRLAVRERNEMGGIGQSYLVELVALNDDGEAVKAEEQARKMAVDPLVLGVLGGFSEATTAVAEEYDLLRLAFLSPELDIIELHSVLAADADFIERYGLQSGGVEPGPAAVWAYLAANRLMDAMESASLSGGRLTRSRMWAAMESGDW